MPRRSARINVGGGEASHKQPVQSPETDSQEPESPEPDEYAQDDPGNSSRKRQKTRRTSAETPASPTALKVKGKRGKLRMLPEMPLDILFEIFGHLTPSDLIHLARTTKALRRILMRRSTISIWKQAFSNDSNLPACPPDLNEPQFANLLFSRHCHFCSRSNVQDVLWAQRVRACENCLSQRFVNPTYYGNNLYPVSFLHRRRGRRFAYCLAADRDHVSQELKRLEDCPAELTQFRVERGKFITQLQDHVRECQLWQENRKRNRTLELNDNRMRRRDAILAKLAELGWSDELEFLDISRDSSLHDHPLVKLPKDLTERMWNNIKDEMVEFLQTIKAKRLKKEYISVIKERMKMLDVVIKQFYSTRATTEVLPVPADFCNMEPYRTIVMDASRDVILTPAFLEDVDSHLSDLSAAWYRNCNQFLLGLIPLDSEVATKDDLAPLHLAATIFHCQHCDNPITYPRVLEHQCTIPRKPDEYLEDEFLAGCAGIGSEPWNYGNNQFTFDHKTSNCAKAIVTTCEMDPDIVTSSEMDTLDHRIECLRCFDVKKGRLLMGWKAAISHYITHHSQDKETSPSTPHWKLVDKATVLRIKKTEVKLQVKDWESHYALLRCRFCRMRFHGKYAANSHMSSAHSTHSEVLDSTYPCRDISTSLTATPPVRTRIGMPKLRLSV